MKAPLAIGVALAALATGAALWWQQRPEPLVGEATISGAALYAASFTDAAGAPASLGRYQGKTLVLNFWATWCGPCREEMPALARVAERWKDRGVAFVGISDESPETIARFGREVKVPYPLWSSGAGSSEMESRLGNRVGGIPFTAIVGPDGRVATARVGPYTETELERELSRTSAKGA